MTGIAVVIESHIPDALKMIDKVARERMWEATNAVRIETLLTLSGQRSGRVYKVPGTKQTYTASAPGEPPAQRTGELRQSIKIVIEADSSVIAYKDKDTEQKPATGTQSELVGLVGTEKSYGPMLEFGTHRMAARPWLRKSFEKAKQKVNAIFNREWTP